MFNFTIARQHMVESQIRTNDVTHAGVLQAFRKIPRENFIPKSQKALAYGEAHIKIDDERWMVRPRDFSKLIQAARVQDKDIVLDIACGRGYSTAILAQMAETVVGLEDNEERVDRATQELDRAGVTNAAIVKGDLKVGASEHGPFDVIFINGAVSDISKSWLDQLANGGRLVCVKQVGPIGHATVYTRAGDTVGERVLFDASIPVLPSFKAETVFAF